MFWIWSCLRHIFPILFIPWLCPWLIIAKPAASLMSCHLIEFTQRTSRRLTWLGTELMNTHCMNTAAEVDNINKLTSAHKDRHRRLLAPELSPFLIPLQLWRCSDFFHNSSSLKPQSCKGRHEIGALLRSTETVFTGRTNSRERQGLEVITSIQ